MTPGMSIGQGIKHLSLSISPSKSSLPIPPSGSSSTHASPYPSPSASASASWKPTNDGGYFSRPTARDVKTSREEALKTVKAIEDVLSAWNDYRLTLLNTSKAGKKLASALKDLTGHMDKNDIASQTMKPAADVLDGVAELTAKLAKRSENEYDEANAAASKYFSLLAKESTSHDAYLGAIGKKHDKAEKAYRQASKVLADTSTAHLGLLDMKQTLEDDIGRAHNDHISHIGSKQASLLLHLASSSGALATTLVSFFSDGLRKSGAAYSEIAYFRALADVQWRGSLPSSFDEDQHNIRRDELRAMKARVASGEADIIGSRAWNHLSADGGDTIRPTFRSPIPNQRSVSSNAMQVRSVPMERQSSPVSAIRRPPLSARHWSSVQSTTSSGSGQYSAGPSGEGASSTTTGRSNNPQIAERSRYEDSRPLPIQRGSYPDPRVVPPLGPRPTPRSSSNSMTIIPPKLLPPQQRARHAGPESPARRSVSAIVTDMQARIDSSSPTPAHTPAPESGSERQKAFEVHQSHREFVSECELCWMDYERMLGQTAQSHTIKGSRRVTMPPSYNVQNSVPVQSEHTPRTLDRALDQQEQSGHGHGHGHLRQGAMIQTPNQSHTPIIAPSPRRVTGMSPEL